MGHGALCFVIIPGGFFSIWDTFLYFMSHGVQCFCSMRYIAAYVLAVMGGNPDPTAEDIRTIVSSVGIDIDESRLNKVITELRGKDLEELIAQGELRLCVVLFKFKNAI